MILRWSQRAASQLFEAADYLDGERPGTGDRLYTAVDQVVAIIKEQPGLFRATLMTRAPRFAGRW